MRNNAFKSVETHYKRFIDLELRAFMQIGSRGSLSDVGGASATGGGISESVGEHALQRHRRRR